MAQRSTHLRYPGGKQSLLGALAYLAGYVVVFGWKSGDIDTVLEQISIEGTYQSSSLAEAFADAGVSVSATEGSGWLFYSAHHVSVRVPTPAGTSTRMNILSGAGGDFLLLYLVPPVVLVVAGSLATLGATNVRELRFDLGDSPFVRYWYNGAFPVTFGYLPLAIVGAFVFSLGRFGPDLLLSWVLVGMVYPFVFGGLGGSITLILRRNRS